MRSTANGPGKPARNSGGKRSLKGSRRLGAVAIVGLSMLGLTGCTYIAPQQTTHVYSPSDGIRFNMGDVEFRNILVISRDAGEEGRILGAVYNTSGQEALVTFSGSTGASTQVSVPAQDFVLFNQRGPEMILGTVTQPPGGLEPITVTTSLGEETTKKVPVLDGTLEEYRPYVPTETDSSPDPTATESAPAAP